MSDIVAVRNNAKHDISVSYMGDEYILSKSGTEKAEQLLDRELANLFTEMHGDLVEVVEMSSLGATHVEVEPPKTVWLANVTGNEDEPEKIKAGSLKNPQTGVIEARMVQNPRRAAVPLKRWMKGDERKYPADGGGWGGIVATEQQIVLKPFTRKEVTKEIGEWFLNRDGGKGMVIRSRAPSDFEPNLSDKSWTLDRIRAYLYLIDSNAVLEPTEAEIKYAHGKADLDAAKAIELARIKMFRKCFLRMVKTNVALPKPERHAKQVQDFAAAAQVKIKALQARDAAAVKPA